jgi:hypothetical protein
MGGRRAQPAWDAAPSNGSSPTRVVVENGDFGIGYAVERVLEEAGYEVMVCGGPENLSKRSCPLVIDGSCDLVAGADVIVHSLNLDRPEHAEVLRAIRSKYPHTPVVVEVPGPTIARHQGLLDGCEIVAFPANRDALLGAVAGALAKG